MVATEELKRQAELYKEKCVQVVPSSNIERRILYSDLELLGIKIDRKISELVKATGTDTSAAVAAEIKQLQELKHDLSALSSTINLMFVKRSKSIVWRFLSRIDDLIRLFAVWLFLAASAVFIALPCIFLSPVDYWLVKRGLLPRRFQLNILGKTFISTMIVQLSGINLVRQGSVDAYLHGTDCVLTCFSHASSLDAFITTSCIPSKSYTMAKSELFLIPFFSWCMLAFGGVPVNRSNRDQAVKALGLAARSAKMGDSIVIAPEGTRSKSGQLSAFKKGPFYIWEDMKTLPIVPIVTFGAFELFPPGRQMTHPGKVYIRFLKPIQPHEASSRDEMSLLLRQRMLEALRDVPADVGSQLTWPQRIQFTAYQILVFYTCWKLYTSGPFLYIKNTLKLSTWQFVGCSALVSIVLTLLLYVYMLYIKLWLVKKPVSDSNSPIKAKAQ